MHGMEDRRCDDDSCRCNGGEEKDHCTHCRGCFPKYELTSEKGWCKVCALKVLLPKQVITQI